MVKSKKNTASKQLLNTNNVIDMELFFEYRNNSSDYWMSAMINIIDNLTDKQKIRLARKIITDEDALTFFFRQLYKINEDQKGTKQ